MARLILFLCSSMSGHLSGMYLIALKFTSKLILNYCISSVCNFQVHRREAPLIQAARGAHWNVLPLLLEKGADVNSQDRVYN